MCKLKNVLSVALIIFMVSFTFGCELNQSVEDQGEKVQTNIMQRAIDTVPVPQITNFLTRKAVAKWLKRMDQPQKEFYNYLMAGNGQIVHYFVSQGRPVSIGTFMTPTQKEYDVRGSGTNQLGPAPSLDGMYYGSGGSAGTARFTFDAGTDAYFEVVGVGNFIMIITDQPLDIEAPKLTVIMETVKEASNK